MARILVHGTHGPEAPARAALAFLVARTAPEQGHPPGVAPADPDGWPAPPQPARPAVGHDRVASS